MGTEARVPIPLHPWFAVSVHVSDLKPTETEDSFLPSICPAKSNVLVLPPAPSFPSFSSIQPWAACPLLSFFLPWSVEPIFRSSLAACPVQRLHPLFPAQSAGTARGPYKKGHAGQHTPRSCRRPCLPVLVPIYFSQTVLIQNAPCFHDPFVEPAFR